jgi:hypothetical protein
LQRTEQDETSLTFASDDLALHEGLVWFGFVDSETGETLQEGFAVLHPGLFNPRPTATMRFGPGLGFEKSPRLAFALVQPEALTATHVDALRWSLSAAAEEPLREQLRKLIDQVEGKQGTSTK